LRPHDEPEEKSVFQKMVRKKSPREPEKKTVPQKNTTIQSAAIPALKKP
jgi:hypothetical protein